MNKNEINRLTGRVDWMIFVLKHNSNVYPAVIAKNSFHGEFEDENPRKSKFPAWSEFALYLFYCLGKDARNIHNIDIYVYVNILRRANRITKNTVIFP